MHGARMNVDLATALASDSIPNIFATQLLPLERRALLVFVGRRREFAAVKCACDFLHFLEHLVFLEEGSDADSKKLSM